MMVAIGRQRCPTLKRNKLVELICFNDLAYSFETFGGQEALTTLVHRRGRREKNNQIL